MNKLVIVRDELNQKDKGSTRFTKALVNECGRNNVHVQFESDMQFIEEDSSMPVVVMQPSNIKDVKYNNMDLNTTAEVCFDFIENHVKENNLSNPSVYIYGNGKTVGKPLRKIIEGNDKYKVEYANSKTTKAEKIQKISKADFVVMALSFGVVVEEDLKDKVVIDCSNSYKKVPRVFFSMGEIGKQTVQKIIGRIKY